MAATWLKTSSTSRGRRVAVASSSYARTSSRELCVPSIWELRTASRRTYIPTIPLGTELGARASEWAHQPLDHTEVPRGRQRVRQQGRRQEAEGRPEAGGQEEVV